MKKNILLWCFSILAFTAAAQNLKVASGTTKHFEKFPSKFIAPRNVDVWLPDGYSKTKRYAVLYMHDGQMLFDSTVTWNHQEWGVDESMTALLKNGKIRDCIVVGIWNTPARREEYYPQKAWEQVPQYYRDTLARKFGIQQKVLSDDYLKFIVRELKPFIDSAFSVKSDRKNTFIAGSSMGGLISMYAICEYPKVFSGAACLSTHWPGGLSPSDNPSAQALLAYFRQHLPSPKSHKFYFDFGSKTLDAWYEPFQKKADDILRNGGFSKKNWLTRSFPGDDHSEKSWAKRLGIPLGFLLKP